MTDAVRRIRQSNLAPIVLALGVTPAALTGLWLLAGHAPSLTEICLSPSASAADALLTIDLADPSAWRAPLQHGLGMSLAMAALLLWRPLVAQARAGRPPAGCVSFASGFLASWLVAAAACLLVAALLAHIAEAALTLALAIGLGLRVFRLRPRAAPCLALSGFDAGLNFGAHCARDCGALTVACLLLPTNAHLAMAGLMIFMALDRPYPTGDAARGFHLDRRQICE